MDSNPKCNVKPKFQSHDAVERMHQTSTVMISAPKREEFTDVNRLMFKLSCIKIPEASDTTQLMGV